MEPILLVCLMVFATLVAIVWIALTLVSMVVRGVLGIARKPFQWSRQERERSHALATGNIAATLAPLTECDNRKCRASLPAHARFCSRCGTELRHRSQPHGNAAGGATSIVVAPGRLSQVA